MKKPLSVWAVYIRLLALWMSGLKIKAYLMIRDSKKDRLLSITSVLIYVPRLLSLPIMMSYLSPAPSLREYIKVKKKNSMQTNPH